MASLPDLIGRIRIDTSDLDRASNEAQTRSTAIGSAMGSAVGGLAAAGLDSAIGAISNFVAGSVEAFAEFEDAAAAAGVRFGESVGIVTDFSNRSAEAFGISKAAAIEGANTFSVFGSAAGLAGDDLALFSTQMVGLAGDMASFSGGTPEEAIQAIGAAFRGETDPIERYGVLINAAAVENKALEMGLVSQGEEMSANARVMATQALILEQTSAAHGDFARNIEGTSNQQKLMAAQSANLSVELGERLAPAFLFAKEMLLGLITGITGFAGVVGSVINFLWQWRDAIAVAAAALLILNAQTIAFNVAAAAYLAWVGAVRVATIAWTAVQWLLNAALTANPIGLVVAAIAVLVGAFVIAWNHSETFRNFVLGLWSTIGRFVTDALSWFGSFARGVGDAFNAVFGWIGRLLGWIGALPGQIGAALSAIPGVVWRFLVKTWEDAVELHNRIMWTLVRFLEGIPGWINRALGGIPGMVWDFLVGAFQNATNAVSGWIGNLINYVRSIPTQIVNALWALPGQMYNIGADIIRGLLNGLKSLGGQIVSYLTNLIPGPVRQALGIASRSKVMERIGRDAVEGLDYGLNALRGQIRQTSFNIANDAISAIGATNVSVAGAQAAAAPTPTPVAGFNVDARSYGTQLVPEDVAREILWASRVGGMVPA